MKICKDQFGETILSMRPVEVMQGLISEIQREWILLSAWIHKRHNGGGKILKILCLISLSFLVLICMASQLSAAGHAIRIECTNNGDGTTWNCATTAGGMGAYNTVPATLTRGDTYYFSKGTLTLSEYPLDDPNNGITYITFKKATDSDYGALSGWDSSLGNAQTIFVSLNDTGSIHYNIIWSIKSANAGYYKWDGVYGAGPNAGDYGFRFDFGTRNPPWDSFFVYGNQNPTALEFYHVAFMGIPQFIDHEQQAAWNGWILGKFQYCLFDWMANAVHGFEDDLIVDNCYFTNTWGLGPNRIHGQTISYNGDRLTVTNSYFRTADPWGTHRWDEDNGDDLDMTAFISYNDARIPGAYADNWVIYNNVFVNPGGGNGVLTNSSSGGTGIRNMVFYNNTIIGDPTTQRDNCILHITYSNNSRDNLVHNNIWYNCQIGIGLSQYVGSIIHDYNFWDSTCTVKPTETHGVEQTISRIDMFVNPSNENYRLKAASKAINNGTNLGSPYNIDKDGTARPQGSGWDMGAYEYAGSGDTIAPAPPTNLRIQ